MLNMDQCSGLVATHCSLPAIGGPPHHADEVRRRGSTGPSMGPPAGAAVVPGVPGAAPQGPDLRPAIAGINTVASDRPKIAAIVTPARREGRLIELLLCSAVAGGPCQLLGLAPCVASPMSRPSSCA